MNKKKYLSLLLLSVSIIIIGCADKNTLPDIPLVIQAVDIRLPVQPVDWRSVATDEAVINDALIIVYSADSKGSDLPKIAKNVLLDSIYHSEDIGVVTLKAFTSEDDILDGDLVHVILNYKSSVNLETVTKESFATTFVLNSNSGFVNLGEGLPMYGFEVWSTTEQPVITMKYATAKIQLKMNYRGGVSVPGDHGTTFTVENTTYQLFQISDVGHIDGSPHSSTNREPEVDISSGDISRLSAPLDNNYLGASYIYAYKYATKTIGEVPTVLDIKTANTSRFAMIIKNDKYLGNYQYYRLDLYDKSTGKYLDINNNYHYSIRVDEVNAKGYATAAEALVNPPLDILYDVIVEENGVVVPGYSPYTLDVKEGDSEFGVSEVPTIINLAKVRRSSAENSDIINPTPFTVTIDKGISINGDVSIVVNDAPASLDSQEKIISITASGSGVTMFRYKFTLGSVNYVSPPVKLISNNDMVVIEGFDSSIGVINGYSESRRFGVKVADGYKLKGETNLKKHWDASLTHSIPTKTLDQFRWSWAEAQLEEVTSDSGNLEGVYLNVFRTGPGDPDIDGRVTIIATAPDKGVLSHTFKVKITTDCKLAGKAENYGVLIDTLTWADRNVGASIPSEATGVKYELSRNWTNDQNDRDDVGADHYDYMPSFKVERAGVYIKWPDLAGKCESFELGGGGWRAPTAFGSTNKGEMHDLRKHLRHSKGRVYFTSTAPSTGADKYVGCYLPLAGFQAYKYSSGGYYWSGTPNSNSACALLVYSYQIEHLLYSNQTNGYSLRCVK